MDRNEEFRNWVLENENNPEMDIVMRKILESSASDDHILAKEGFCEFKQRTGLKRKEHGRRLRHYAVKVAACLFIPTLFLCVWALYRNSTSDTDQEWISVCTGVAQTRDVVLSDGTKVTLSPCSQLFYPDKFTGHQRKVMLVGEAFLDVAKNRDHQFVVSAGEMNVIVHGTRFGVSSFPEEHEDEVALVEGSVEMRFINKSGSIFLSPGELVKYDRNSGTTERRKFAANYYEEVVKAGGLQFRNETLADIVASLNRHFNVNIVIENNSLKEERFYASFINGESADEILSALNSGCSFRVEKKDNITYLTK